jgi:hypothetical protein
MKPAKFCWDLETKHKEQIKKPAEYFNRKQVHAKQKLTQNIGTGCDTERAMLGPYEGSLLIAKTGKLHTIAEKLNLLAAKEIASRMLEDTMFLPI